MNIDDVNSKKVPALTKEKVLEEYKDCFDKIGCFPGEKYHIELVDNPKPVIHLQGQYQFTSFHSTKLS